MQPDGALTTLVLGTSAVTVTVTGPGHISSVVLSPSEAGGL